MAGDRRSLFAKIIAIIGMLLFLIPAAVISGISLAETVMGGGWRTGIVSAIAGVAWIAGVMVLRNLVKRAPREDDDR